MANHDYDPVIAEADRRVERAKASLRARLATLEHRLGDVRDRLDVAEHIRRHPLPAVAIALAVGALAGGRGASSGSAAAAERSLGATAMAAIGAIGLRIVREIAISQLSRAARQWAEAPRQADEFGGDATISG
jgi:hypothetical protein